MRGRSFMVGEVAVEHLVLGPIQTNVYLVTCGDELMVVDPGDGCAEILDALNGRAVKAIVLTHCHFDHIGAAAELNRATGAPVVVSAVDAPFVEDPSLGESRTLPASEPCEVDQRLEDGDTFTLGSVTWQVMLTPGHTPGSMCLYASNEQTKGIGGVLISGDTLFHGACGRTDFKGGSMTDMIQSLSRLAQLPDATLVLPGHNSFTEIGLEQRGIFQQLL